MKTEVWWNDPSVLLNLNLVPLKNDNNQLINILTKFIILLSILIFIISGNINIIYLVIAFFSFIIIIVNINQSVIKKRHVVKKQQLTNNNILYQSNLMPNRFDITLNNHNLNTYLNYLYQF